MFPVVSLELEICETWSTRKWRDAIVVAAGWHPDHLGMHAKQCMLADAAHIQFVNDGALYPTATATREQRKTQWRGCTHALRTFTLVNHLHRPSPPIKRHAVDGGLRCVSGWVMRRTALEFTDSLRFSGGWRQCSWVTGLKRAYRSVQVNYAWHRRGSVAALPQRHAWDYSN